MVNHFMHLTMIRLETKEIVVRLANEGEKIVTLDDQERTLKSTSFSYYKWYRTSCYCWCNGWS